MIRKKWYDPLTPYPIVHFCAVFLKVSYVLCVILSHPLLFFSTPAAMNTRGHNPHPRFPQMWGEGEGGWFRWGACSITCFLSVNDRPNSSMVSSPDHWKIGHSRCCTSSNYVDVIVDSSGSAISLFDGVKISGLTCCALTAGEQGSNVPG